VAVVVLIVPPACDPTAPYLAVPTLTAYLRCHGVEVIPVDGNVEAFDWLFTGTRMATLRDRLEARLARLERQPTLRHTEQLLYAALWSARAEARAVVAGIERAVAVMRERATFYDPATYGTAVATLDAALRVASATYAPLSLTFTSYKTPFALLNLAEMAADARPERDPFHDYFAGPLLERLRATAPAVVGISIAFPSQLQPAYALAWLIKRALPAVHLTAGGPALTQLFQGLGGEQAEAARGPFDSVVTGEGEVALLELVRTVAAGETPAPWIHGVQIDDLGSLPPPDFRGLPLARYFAPELVLPYDPTRGCYWGRCAFCHYGLAEVGTARYRERPVSQIVDHLDGLARAHGVNLFYLSQDAVNPKTLLQVARAIQAGDHRWRWATDMRPERSLTAERCAELRGGGALAMALGVESAAPRVLERIDKGVGVETVRQAIRHLAGAGIGVEAMAFTDFPTESAAEALATVRFIAAEEEQLALFICGTFDLAKGSRVARTPGDYGVAESWRVAGDELGLGLFYREGRAPKSDSERAQVDDALAAVARRWWLSHYPWAGALSTAHTLLYYRTHGIDCFRRFARRAPARVLGARPFTARARFDVAQVIRRAAADEAAIWHELVAVRRQVSRADYRVLADALPPLAPRPATWRVVAGELPQRVRGAAPGRR